MADNPEETLEEYLKREGFVDGGIKFDEDTGEPLQTYVLDLTKKPKPKKE